MATSSFLHAASAKIIADKLLRDDPANISAADGRQQLSGGALRLLLVEEEENNYGVDNKCDGGGGRVGSLAKSLAMDAAYSLASNSLVPCRGCSCIDAVGNIESNDGNPPPPDAACRCCKVALLIPGQPKKTKKKRQRNNNHCDGGPKFVDGTGKAAFPMHCVRADGMDDGQDEWDQTMLGNIHIKYVNSLGDIIRFLAYAPSLPGHLQPLDGIFLLGLGELVSRENRNTTGVMEFTHVGEVFECALFEKLLYYSILIIECALLASICPV